MSIAVLFRGYGRLIVLAFRTLLFSRGTHARLTPKRSAIMFLWAPCALATQLLHLLCLALDNVLFPAFRRIDVMEPTFIVGIPRSGTTLLHRSLMLDTERFTGVQLWEVMLAPAIIEKKIGMAIGALDRLLGGYGRRAASKIADWLLRDLNEIHPTGLFVAEEDELFFMPVLASLALLYPFPFPDALLCYARFDTEIHAVERAQLMRFYESCIKRHLYVFGPHRQYLAKNPLSTGKVASLLDAFPGAKIIYTMRTPTEAVPSMLSLGNFYWSQFDNDPRGNTFRDQVLDVAMHFYEYPPRALGEYPEDSWAIIQYEDLTADLSGTIQRIYARLRMTMTPEYRELLIAQDRTSKHYTSSHSYRADEQGVTVELIEKHFASAYDDFEFPRSQGKDESDKPAVNVM